MSSVLKEVPAGNALLLGIVRHLKVTVMNDYEYDG